MADAKLKLCRDQDRRRVRVALLVNNTCVYDSRVVRTAESLAGAGADVVVICRADPALPLVERRSDVVYCRVDARRSASWGGLRQKIRRAVAESRLRQVGLAREARGSTHGEDAALIRAPAAVGADEGGRAVQKGGVDTDEAVPTVPEFLRAALADGSTVMLNGREFTALRKRVGMRYSGGHVRLFELALAPFLALERRLAGTAGDAAALPAWKRRVVRLQLYCVGALAVTGRALYRGPLGRLGLQSLRRLARQGPSWLRRLAWAVYRGMPEGIGLRMRVRGFGVPVVAELIEYAPDIVHANELNTLEPAVLYSRLREGRGVRVIYDSHELEAERDRIDSQFSRRMIRRYEARLIRDADAVITVSDSIAEHLRECYGIARPTVVYNAPSVTAIEQAATSPRSLREEAGVDAGTPLGVFVGRLKLGRGQELIIEALAHAPGLHLALVGPRPPKVIAALHEQVERQGLGERVHFIDPVGVDEVVGFIAEADFGIVPTQNKGLSYAYAMPNKLFEMTLAGLPVIGGRLPEIRRYIERTGTGILMNEWDPQDIGRAMREVYAKRDVFAADAGRRRQLAETYSWSAQERRLIGVYLRLLAIDGDPPAVSGDIVDPRASPAREFAH